MTNFRITLYCQAGPCIVDEKFTSLELAKQHFSSSDTMFKSASIVEFEDRKQVSRTEVKR